LVLTRTDILRAAHSLHDAAVAQLVAHEFPQEQVGAVHRDYKILQNMVSVASVGDPVIAGIVIVLVVVLLLAPPWFVAMYAERKGRSFLAYLLAGLFLSWVATLIVAMIVPDRRASVASLEAAHYDD
jgi:uncharacterized membrane protein